MPKSKTKKIPFQNLILDREERMIENSLEKGEYVSAPNFPQFKKILVEAAENHIELQKSKRVTIRINQGDLLKVRAKAAKNGIAYQTLLSILVHKYAEGETQVHL